jgi:c-di-AMP phosphodiesterase-like protein
MAEKSLNKENQEKEGCFHAYVFPYLFILTICIIIFFGAANTNKFLAIVIVFTIFSVLGAISFVLMAIHYYHQYNSVKKQIYQDSDTVVDQMEIKKSNFNEKTTSEKEKHYTI